jgi:replicative DNA helicase
MTDRSDARGVAQPQQSSAAANEDLKAEQALLRAVLTNDTTLDRVADFLDAWHFFDAFHQRIFKAAVLLIASGNWANAGHKMFFENL